MENAGSQNPHPRHWRILYRSAVLETNNSEMAKRLSEAREAIADTCVNSFARPELMLMEREKL